MTPEDERLVVEQAKRQRFREWVELYGWRVAATAVNALTA